MSPTSQTGSRPLCNLITRGVMRTVPLLRRDGNIIGTTGRVTRHIGLSVRIGIFMSPNRMGRGTYCFWCGSHRRQRGRQCPRPHCSISALYLLNQLVDFDHTCIDTLLGRKKEVIRFWWPWPHFLGHTSTLKFSNFDQKRLSAPYLLNQMTDSDQTTCIITSGWFKDLIKFWWPWP